jgi:type III pantothenate kinase
MVVVLDIGNTNIHAGLYDGGKIVRKIITPVSCGIPSDNLQKLLLNERISGAAIASVVPQLTAEAIAFMETEYAVSPLVVNAQLRYPIRICYDTPDTLGADRIANIVGAYCNVRDNLVVMDFGTANTFDVVLKNGDFVGGVITPGMRTSLDTLVQRTALLKDIPLEPPLSIIGQSTEECVQSGIVYGTAAMAEGFMQNVRGKYGKEFSCIITGGLSSLVAPFMSFVDQCDPDLCLCGVGRIYSHNVGTQKNDDI